MTLEKKLPDLQITLSNMIRSIEPEYRDLSQCRIAEKAEGELKKKLLDGISGALDSLTDAYMLVSDVVRLEAEGVDISELLHPISGDSEGE